MRKHLFNWLLCSLLGFSTLCAKQTHLTSGDIEIVNFSEFAIALAEGFPINKLQHYVLECSPGVILPIRLHLSGDMFSLGSSRPVELNLTLLKPCYIKYHDKKGLLFSTDLKNWKEFSDTFVGKADSTLSFHNQIPLIELNMELSQDSRPDPLSSYKKRACSYNYDYRYGDDAHPTPVHRWSIEQLEIPELQEK